MSRVGRTASIGLQQTEVARIIADELADANQEGGLIDLTLTDQETNLFAASLTLAAETISEDLPLAADVSDALVTTMSDVSSGFTLSAVEAAASVELFAVEEVASDSFVPVSLSTPLEEQIDGARGRAQLFDLAICSPVAAAAQETSAAIEPLSSQAPASETPVEVSTPVTDRSGVKATDDLTESSPVETLTVPCRAEAAESSLEESPEVAQSTENGPQKLPVFVAHNESIRDGVFCATERFVSEECYGEVPGADDLANGTPTRYAHDEVRWVTEPHTDVAHQVGDVAESSSAGNSSSPENPDADETIAGRMDAARREGQDAESKAIESMTGLDRGHAKMSDSSQEGSTGEPGNSDLPAVVSHVKPVQAQKADADVDRAQYGESGDDQPPVQVAAVLATGVAGHYLGKRRRQDSIEEPRLQGRSGRSTHHRIL